jgi:hypothetical protein
MTHPSYCCQKCGEQIGYIGRFFQFIRIPLHRCDDGTKMTKLTYEKWSEKNPIDWDKIEDNEDCLVTKDLVEMVHHWEYQLYCKEND